MLYSDVLDCSKKQAGERRKCGWVFIRTRVCLPSRDHVNINRWQHCPESSHLVTIGLLLRWPPIGSGDDQESFSLNLPVAVEILPLGSGENIPKRTHSGSVITVVHINAFILPPQPPSSLLLRRNQNINICI